MYKNLFFSTLTTLLLLFSVKMFAQEEPIQGYLTYSQFYSPGSGPYLETNLAIQATDLVYLVNENGMHQGTVEVTQMFHRGDSVVNYRKYHLNTPEVENPDSIDFKLIDQQRFTLDTGNYMFEILIKDLHNDLEPMQHQIPVNVMFNPDALEISSIQLVRSFTRAKEETPFTRSGINTVPYVSEFYPEEVNTMAFFAEIYNMDKILGENEGYLARFYLESFETNEIMGNYSGFKRMSAQPANIFFHKMDISNLPTGNYNVVVDVRNRENEKVGMRKKLVQRSNPGVTYDLANLEAIDISRRFTENMSRDSLLHYIPALSPISSSTDKLFIHSELNEKETNTLKKFFLNFWSSRNYDEPEEEWLEYYAMVREVEEFFGTMIRRGFETDRGRVYLQYGPPNSITSRSHEPSSYPYEIWHYHQLTQSQWNKRFVFYNPDLVTNDYELLHSNAIGETYNQTWKHDLHKRNTMNIDPYNTDGVDRWGSEAERIYNNPY